LKEKGHPVAGWPFCLRIILSNAKKIASQALASTELFAGRSVPIYGGGKSMFCDGCGSAMQPGQGFCSRCGKQIVGPIMFDRSRRRVQDHIQLLSIFWFAISAFNAIGGVVLYILANTLLAPGGSAGAPVFLRPLLSVVAILILGASALGFCAGWGLMHREPWARTLTVVLAFLVLFINIPFGTAVGVYTMWVLLPSESEQEYGALIEARAA
jgi:hypothetical protein